MVPRDFVIVTVDIDQTQPAFVESVDLPERQCLGYRAIVIE